MYTNKAKMPNPEKYRQKMANSATLIWPLWALFEFSVIQYVAVQYFFCGTSSTTILLAV